MRSVPSRSGERGNNGGVKPETIIFGGKVFDGNIYRPDLSAVAILGGKFVAVGGEEVMELGQPGTKLVDARGGLISPGFIDSHIHPIEGGMEHGRCDLSGLASRDEILGKIAEYAKTNPDLDWILGGGWQMASFPGGTPLAADLDRIIPDRPVYLPNRDHHGTWVNSAALRIAGIDRHTPDPADGRIERDDNGNPTGTLHEGATTLVKKFIPADTDQEKYQALLTAQKILHSVGITGWQDAIVGNYGGHSDTCHVYQKAADSGDLVSRVVGALWWDRDRGVEQIAEFREKRAAHRGDLFRADSIKIMVDGIPENHTAALGEPYIATGCHCSGEHRGISFVEQARLIEAVTALDADGFQVHVHAIGDRAVTESLNAFEKALERNGKNDNRHHIAHLQIVRPSDTPRFKQLGVTANLQTLWASFEPQMLELNIPALGPERSAWQYPFADLLASGAESGSGSDWPVTSPNPWEALHVAVNRKLPPTDHDYNETPFYPEQAISLEQGLASYTRGSARINHADTSGKIAVGFTADLVVTNRDPFGEPKETIAETEVLSTYIGGTEVFARW